MISFSVVGLDGCRTSAVLNAYLDIVDKSDCMNNMRIIIIIIIVITNNNININIKKYI